VGASSRKSALSFAGPQLMGVTREAQWTGREGEIKAGGKE